MALNTRGGDICDFQLQSPFISERYEIGSWLLWNVNMNS